MSFPLAEWIDSHAECRHNLGRSGMLGAVRHPLPTPAEVRDAEPELLQRELANSLHVAPDRVFLTHGATEANAWVALYLGRSPLGAGRRVRVCFPEYPPLVDIFRWAGFSTTVSPGSAAAAVISRPRNPEGILWSSDRLHEWVRGARAVVVDETFREFAGVPSVAARGERGWWATGSFTKFYAADDLRVGFVVAPEEEAAAFGRFHGLASDLVSPYSIAGARAALRDQERMRREIRAIVDRNVARWQRSVGGPVPVAPIAFDRSGENGDSLARRCLKASVLVCPGSLFGDPSGVRVCLTRRGFPSDLRAYLAVRGKAAENGRPSAGRPRRSARLRRG